MIDTIQIDLLNNEKHYHLLRRLDKEIHKGIGLNFMPVEDDNVSFIKKTKFKPVLEFKDTKKLVRAWEKLHMKSNHKDIIVIPYYARGFTRFNFSIPKYIYGNNVQQFLPNPWNQNFKFVDNRLNGMKGAIDVSYVQLKRFINNFFKHHFSDQPIDPADVTISRIDFCYNQFFPTKQMAIDYLNEQKKMHRKHSRLFGKEQQNHDFGISYTRSGYYNEKIYHKGSEYKSRDGDRSWHLSENKRLGKKYYDVNMFQNTADKILRYEMTFHGRGIDRIFKEKIFRKEDKVWRREVKDIALLEKKRYCKRVGLNGKVVLRKKGDHDFIGYGLRKTIDGRRVGEFVLQQNFSRTKKDRIKFARKVDARKITFCFNKNLDGHRYFKKWDGEYVIAQHGYFSQSLFKQMGLRFLKFVYSYRLKEMMDNREVLKRFMEHKTFGHERKIFQDSYSALNDITDAKKNENFSYLNYVSVNRFKWIVKMIDKGSSLRELYDNEFISRRYYYYLLRYFKYNGWDENTRDTKNILALYDYSEYYAWIRANRLYLPGLNYRL